MCPTRYINKLEWEKQLWFKTKAELDLYLKKRIKGVDIGNIRPVPPINNIRAIPLSKIEIIQISKSILTWLKRKT